MTTLPTRDDDKCSERRVPSFEVRNYEVQFSWIFRCLWATYFAYDLFGNLRKTEKLLGFCNWNLRVKFKNHLCWWMDQMQKNFLPLIVAVMFCDECAFLLCALSTRYNNGGMTNHNLHFAAMPPWSVCCIAEARGNWCCTHRWCFLTFSSSLILTSAKRKRGRGNECAYLRCCTTSIVQWVSVQPQRRHVFSSGWKTAIDLCSLYDGSDDVFAALSMWKRLILSFVDQLWIQEWRWGKGCD